MSQQLGFPPNHDALARFLAESFRRAPVAHASAAIERVALFEWSTLDRILQTAPDVLVVARGRLLDERAPRDLGRARALLDRGASLVVRRAQAHERGLADLAQRFADAIPGDVQIQLFVTPAKGRGFGWHYDAEDVFILQTGGVKTYLMRENTIDPAPAPSPRYDFAAIARETTPTGSARSRRVTGSICRAVGGTWRLRSRIHLRFRWACCPIERNATTALEWHPRFTVRPP